MNQSIDLPETALSALSLITRRRSIAPLRMKSDAIPESYIEAMLEAARWAPTHGRTEPWRFIVFTGAAIVDLGAARVRAYEEVTPEPARQQSKIDKIGNIHAQVPLVIAIACATNLNPSIPPNEDRAAVACAVQNISLVATALGLGAFWSTGALAYSSSMRAYLNLPDSIEPMGFLFIGYPSIEWPTGTRSELGTRVQRRS